MFAKNLFALLIKLYFSITLHLSTFKMSLIFIHNFSKIFFKMQAFLYT